MESILYALQPLERSGDGLLTPCQVQPGDVEIRSVASKVSNGEVWILDGVLNYSR